MLLKMKMPAMLAQYVPAFITATLIVGIIIPLLTLATRFWRVRIAVATSAGAASQPATYRPYLVAAGVNNSLLYILCVWLAAALGICMLWWGASMVAAKSTLDASYTLADVDPAIHSLIKRASGGLIDPVKDGFMVSVGQPPREVDIGKTSCGLFCFVLARAMMSESMECSCNADIMRQVSVQANKVHAQAMMPALICALAALLCTLGLLCAAVGQFSSVRAAQAAAAGRLSSPASSECMVETDAAIQVDQHYSGSATTKEAPKVANVV
jgi:hypothetical protein